jgi:hypothetical protein
VRCDVSISECPGRGDQKCGVGTSCLNCCLPLKMAGILIHESLGAMVLLAGMQEKEMGLEGLVEETELEVLVVDPNVAVLD